MGKDDKLENSADEMVGKGKQALGNATDDDDLAAEGKKDEAKSDVKKAGENIKDAFKK